LFYRKYFLQKKAPKNYVDIFSSSNYLYV